MYRSFIAQKKYGVVLDEIRSNASDELKYVRLMAEYLSNDAKKYGSLFNSQLDAKVKLIVSFKGIRSSMIWNPSLAP